jgi:hypothetical protein
MASHNTTTATRSIPSRKRLAKVRKPPVTRSPKRASRAPKPTNVDGHLLSPEIYRAYEAAILDRHKQGNSLANAERMALEDAINQFRPSRWAKDELLRAFDHASKIATAFASMGGFNWSAGGEVLKSGCDCIGRLSIELTRASMRVSDIRLALLSESEEKLQRWQHRRQLLAGAAGARS